MLNIVCILPPPPQEVSNLSDVDISADSVASLVTSGHDLHIGAEEETSHAQ